ncbi:MAG: hypothetical protein GY774_34620 [Planctomycetes bacterium]|nr:hypothetical protein [Planctomycetota bacterium]
MDISLIVGILVAVIVGIIILYAISMASFFRRATADEALIRTGKGGAKVVISGGVWRIPILHEIRMISLETLRLEVNRSGQQALITKDNMRVDLIAQFYVNVPPTEDEVKGAARSLGERSVDPASVKELVEAKLDGALRSVAATMELVELHQKREDFTDQVQVTLKDDLRENGLSLETVSIVSLDQTSIEVFDEQNVFDAQGLRRIVETTEAQRREKNAIQQQTEVDIIKKNVEAEKNRLELERERQFATAEQQREILTNKNERETETQKFKIEQERSVRETDIAQQQAVREAEIAREQRLQEVEIAKNTALIERNREMEEASIAKELAVETAEKNRQIALIAKQKEQELAKVEELSAVAEREKAQQNVMTVEKTAGAERERGVAVIQQRAVSEREQIERQIAADANAYEIKRKADAEAEAAEKQALAIERLAEARLKEGQAKAEAERAMVEAKNAIKTEILIEDAVLKFIDGMPQIIAEAMKPAEKISDIRVLQISGDAMQGGPATDGGTVNKIVDALIQTGAALPMFKEMLKFAGVDTDNKTMTEIVREAVASVPALQQLSDLVPERLRQPHTQQGHPKESETEQPSKEQ